ncbi:transcriptional regulator [uncultured Helicobacter sp.]|uniref:transcriptional regulator n=1 Tax=uncultured Helicobacter sp. TaxID=175537 RepID=UPI00262DFC8F|nr:transcriptional regulator [uncultured Helicobacter sp.]
MTQRNLAGKLDINVKTLRKWKKDRPKVYRLLMIGLKAESMIANCKENARALEQLIQYEERIESEIEYPRDSKGINTPT